MSDSLATPTNAVALAPNSAPLVPVPEVLPGDAMTSSAAATTRIQLITSIAELTKAVAWPFVIMLFALVFFRPLLDTLRLIPERLRNANKASVGTLSWEIDRQARRQ